MNPILPSFKKSSCVHQKKWMETTGFGISLEYRSSDTTSGKAPCAHNVVWKCGQSKILWSSIYCLFLPSCFFFLRPTTKWCLFLVPKHSKQGGALEKKWRQEDVRKYNRKSFIIVQEVRRIKDYIGGEIQIKGVRGKMDGMDDRYGCWSKTDSLEQNFLAWSIELLTSRLRSLVGPILFVQNSA